MNWLLRHWWLAFPAWLAAALILGPIIGRILKRRTPPEGCPICDGPCERGKSPDGRMYGAEALQLLMIEALYDHLLAAEPVYRQREDGK